MGYFLDRVKNGSVPDELTENPKQRNIRTMEDVLADNEREGIETPSVYGKIIDQGEPKRSNARIEKRINASKIVSGTPLFPNTTIGPAPKTTQPLSAADIWKYGAKRLLETSMESPFSSERRREQAKIRDAAKMALDTMTVKREQGNSPGTLVETRWSGKTYGTDTNQNGRLDTFEVESGSNPFNNFYYTLAKPAATAVKDSLIAGGHAFNDGVYSFLAGVGDYLYNIPRAAAKAVEERNPFAKVKLETPFTDSAPIQTMKNNAEAAREQAGKSAGQFGAVGEFANQIMQSTAQMAPSMIAAYLTAGMSAAGDLSRVGMTTLSKAAEMLKLPKHMIPTFVSQAGQSYSDALKQTGDPARALGFGIINGYANALIEQGGVQSEIASGNLQSAARRGAWNFIKENMLQEGAEEITQNWTEKGLRKMMIDQNAPLVSMNDENAVINPKRDLYAGAVGAAAGGLFGGANMAFQNIGNIQNRTQTDRLQQGLTRANERTSASKNQTSTYARNNDSSMSGNEGTVAPTGVIMRNVRNVGQGTSMNQANMEPPVDSRTTQEVATNQNVPNSSDKSTGVKAGEVTTIYSPYEGEKPVQTDSVDNTPIPVSQESVQNAVSAVEQAKNNKEGISLRSALRKTYERLFDKSGGAKHVPVKNMAFRNEPYVVDVNKNAISKIISDKNLTVEKLSLLDNLHAIIENGKYVGSGNYVQKGNKKKLTVRFDYFETPVRINGKDYIAVFDVEVFPNTNQYRTHKVIEKMDLIALPDADTGPVPAANGNASSPTTSIPENSGNVNGELRNGETVTGVQENNTPGILTSEEEGAIIRYKGGGSYALNDTIREGNQLTESQSKQVQDLNRALERMPRVEGTVYRNIGFLFEDSFNKFIEENSGRTVTYPAFTSASKTPDGYEVETPYQVHMEIESKNGRDLTGIGTEMEEEVLFKTDTTFQIHSAQRNGNIFHLILEEVAENGNQSGHDTRTTEGNRGSIPGNDTVGVGEGSHIELDTVQGRGGTAAEIPKGTSTGNVPGSEPGDTRNRDGRSKEKGADSASERQAIYGNLNESKDRAQQNAGGEQFETRTLDRAARIQEEATRAREAQDPKRKVEQAAEAIGRKVEWYSDQSDPAHANQNGYYKDGVVHINETAQNPYMTVLGHESFHSLNAKDRAAIIQFVKQNTNTDSAAFQRYREERRRAYMAEYQKKGRLFSDWDFWEEYTADNMENFFQDEAFVSKLGRQNKTLAEKLWNTLRNLWEKIKQVISPKQYSIGMNEAGQVSGMTDAQFHRMEQMFQKALGHESELGTDGKASIMKRNGEYVINVDRDIFQGANKNDYPKILRQWLDENFEDEQIVSLVDNNVLTLNKKGNKELAYGANSQKLHGSTRVAKNRISQHIDEVARIAKTVNIAPDKQLSTGKNKHGAFAQDGWKYKDFTFKIGDQLYSGRLNVAMNPTGEYVYDITKIKRYPQNETSIENGARIKANTSSDINNISQNQDSVNSSISGNGQKDTEKSSIKRSRFYDSTQNTDNLTQETKEAIAQEAEAFDYEGISNKETMEKAVQGFKNNPLKTAATFLSMQPKAAKAKDIATGFVLLQNYQQLQDYDSAVAVAKKLREIGTQKGQEVQAFSILNRLTPEGMLYYAQSELDSALEIIAQTKGQDWVNKNRDKFTLTDEEANFIVDTMKRVPSITDERQRKVMIAEVQKLIQEKIPKNLPQNIADKLRSVQRISMLLNPKTIVTRNFGSNVIMAIPHLASEAIGSGIDKAVSKATGVRTTTAPNLKNLGKGFGKGFYDSFDDFRRGINTRDIQDDRFHLGSGPAFRGKYNPLRFLDNITSYLLDTGDRPFFEAYFLDSLNGQMKANKVDKPTADMIDIATQSALEKTWQDTNLYTKSAEWIKRGLNLGMKFGLGDIVLPFTKTPANLAKALIDFSPVGFTRGLVADGARLVQAKKRGTLTPQIQRRFVNNVSKGIVGMILYAAAMAVASKGVLSGSDKEDDKDARAFKRDVLGINPYAIKFGNLSGTYDWAQPIGGIMAISADIANQNMSEDSAVNILTNALAAGGNTLFDQSVLTGVSEFFKAADGNIMEALQGAVADIPSQLVPTLLKQIADLTDPVKRSTYDPNKVQQALNTGIAKIPGLEKRLQPSVDVLGRDVKRFGGKNNWFNVFLNPANVNIANPTPELKEVWKVFEETQDTGVFPKLVGNSITNKGITYPLSAQEKTDYQRTLGQETDKGLQELMKSDGYQNASGVQKAEYIKTIISNSDYKAKRELLKQKGVTDSIEDFKNSVAVKKKYYTIWDEVEPEDEDKQARRKAINEVSSVVNTLSKKSKLTPGVISGLNQYMDKIESRAANAVDKELNRLGLLREENTDTTGDMDVTSSTMGMFEYTDDGQKYAVNVNYADIPKIMQEVEEETYKQMQRLLNNQYRSQKKKTYGQRYNYKNANADQKIKWVNEVRTDVRNYYKDKYARKYGVRKVPNKLKGVR